MAPLAATVATGVAVGMVGLALARSERDRRRAGRRDHDRRLGMLHGETLADGLRRMAVGQLDLAIELLGGGDSAAGAPDEKAIHDTRKAIKRLRALLRLLRGELGARAYRREDDLLRDVARRLSGARDASVMLATLDALIEHQPLELGRRRGVAALRRRLAADSARVRQHTLADPHERAELLGQLHALRWRVSAWSLPAGPGMQLIEADLHRIYRQGRSRAKLAARGKGGRRARMQTMHSWRKRVKDLRYAAEMLERHEHPLEQRRPSKDSRRASKSLRELASRADRLGELLGDEHDLAILEAHLRAAAQSSRRRGSRRGKSGHRKSGRGKSGHDRARAGDGQDALWSTGRRTRKALLRAVAKRRRALRKRALGQGEWLYAHQPSRFMRRMRAAVS